MLKQGSSDPTSPRREASLFDLPGPSGPGFFLCDSPRFSFRPDLLPGKVGLDICLHSLSRSEVLVCRSCVTLMTLDKGKAENG